ncbi:cell wall hydrolase [Paracoccus litorisediminis]|nr:cell wall hydrolase [Paracoccus litorisediminis]
MRPLEIVLSLFLTSGVDPAQYTPADALCLTRVVYHEARGESLKGQKAVAHVVLNRAEDDRYPDDVCAVTKQPAQFAPQVRRKPGRVDEPEAFKRAAKAALGAMAGETDPTHGATHFYAPKGGTRPGWARKMRVAAVVGGHKFLKGRR